MKKESIKKEKGFYLVSVDMGYGHQRAAYPFLESSIDGIITANNYPEATEKEKNIWTKDRKNYEAISKFKVVPVLGDFVFSIMDYFQKIDPFYPRRDLSKPSMQQRHFFKKVKKGLGKNLIDRLNKKPLPLVTTFFVAASTSE